jgi:negative regulator of sigma E activity
MTATHKTDRSAAGDADLEALSAWLDGELEPEQDGAMLQRLKSDPRLRAQFEWFNLAGDALRSHEVAACHQPDLVGRVQQALAAEPVRVGPGALSGSRVRRHVATAITVAAAAGVLAVVALPQLRGDGAPAPAAAPMAVASQPERVANAAASVSKSLPSNTPTLDAYLRAHRELAATGVMPSAVAYIRMAGEPER